LVLFFADSFSAINDRSWLGYRFYKQKKSLNIFGESNPLRPPEETAKERLAKLKELNLPGQGRIKEYYIMLSEIYRQYLEGRFQLPVIDRTTGELYLEMREAEIDKKICQAVKIFWNNVIW